MFPIILIISSCTWNVVTSENAWKQPVIGIVAQEISPTYKTIFPDHSFYIAYSYVQAVESSGAKVVPIIPRRPEDYYKKLLYSLNGIVLPGGGCLRGDGNPYYDTVKIIYNISKEINNNGTYFPILGVCLGYEFLLTVANDDNNILKNCSLFHKNYPLKFTEPIYMTTLFYQLTSQQASVLNDVPSTYNYHWWCAYPEDFKKSAGLFSLWKITSTSTTENGTTFVSSIEHIKYPFLGIQFHPEKIAFEWHQNDNVPHSHEILIANRYFYDQLVELSKKNDHAFLNEDEEKANLIYNYNYSYTLKFRDKFMCMYVFN